MLSLLTYYCGFSSPLWTWLDNISRCSSDRYRGAWWQLSQWQSVTWASTSHEVFRAEWLFGTLVNQTRFSMNLTDPVFFPFLRKFLCTAQFSAIVLFLVILIVSACGLTVGSPADCECVTAGRLGRLLEGCGDCQATACFCLASWFKQRGIFTGLCLVGEVVYDERLLPCEHTDSVTQNVCVLPLLWETGYPVQSFL